MSNSTPAYGNDSISQLKGADRVRKRPGVIFGSDGLDGCQHAVFEILSNAIDEAREGHGELITLTRYEDGSIEVEDFGRGCPVDWNPVEKRFNWELVFCELYAGGKYKNADGGDYEYSLGLNGLGSCATQYASEYMDVTVWRDGKKYQLHFKKGKVCGKKGEELQSEPSDRKKTGTLIRWRPDREVFTDIDIPEEYFEDVLHRQAVVNAGVTFRLRFQRGGKFETRDYRYENGITDYVRELAGEGALTAPYFISAERRGRDREDKPEYKVKLSAAFCFSNKVNAIEYYHNNITGTLNLVDVMRNHGCKSIIFSSSATVYGDPAEIPITENCPKGVCTNPYGWTKWMQEQILTDLHTADPEWNVVLLRYFNPIGAHPSGLIGEDPKGIPNNLLPYVAQVAVGRLERINVFGNDYPTPDGTGVRDYIHVVDLARGHLKALKFMEGKTGVNIFNLGTGTGYSVLDVIHAFEKACGKSLPYVIQPRRAGDISACYASPEKASRELGWKAEYGLADMCSDTWRWQQGNPNGYDD